MPLIFSSTSLATAVAVILFLILRIRSAKEWSKRSRGKLLPPGPQPLPVIGNLLDMPRAKSWYGFRDMANKYGAHARKNRDFSLAHDLSRRCILY